MKQGMDEGRTAQHPDLALIRSSGLFDEAWYLANNPDVADAKIDPALHYLRFGGLEGSDPCPDFCSNRYLDSYKDIKKARINPLVHYLKYGKKEGRFAYSTAVEFINEATLVSLLVPPPWQIELLEASSNKYDQPEQAIESGSSQALFTIILLVNNPPAHFLNNCIRSIQKQSYKNWQLEIYINEGGLWNADALAMQFIDTDSRIYIKGAAFESDEINEFKKSIFDSLSEYVIFLNPYDELKPNALSQAINEIAVSKSDLLYCPNDAPSIR